VVSLLGLLAAVTFVAVASRFAANEPQAAANEQHTQEQENNSISHKSVQRG
jgi:hypothetical protein